MNNLTITINKLVTDFLGQGVERISDTWDIPVDEISSVLKNINLNTDTPKKHVKNPARKINTKNKETKTSKKQTKEDSNVETDNDDPENTDDESDFKVTGCIHILSRGRVGETCGKTVARKSETKKYCSTHVNQYENPEKSRIAERKPSEKKGSKKTSQEPEPEIFRFQKSKFGNYTFRGLVANAEKKIYGRETESGSIIPLTDEDINLCNKYKFKIKNEESED